MLRVKRRAHKRRKYRGRTLPKPIDVSETTFLIPDRGRKGRGVKIFDLQKGELSKHGYSLTEKTAVRRAALKKSVEEDGYKTVLGRIHALSIIHRRTNPIYALKAKLDRGWLVSEFGSHT